MAFLQAGHTRHDLAGGAVAALKAVVVDERLLQRVQDFALGQALNGRDFFALGHHGQREAAVHAAAVDQHRAGAALAVVAAFLRARQVEVFAQRVEQRHPRLGLNGAHGAVHFQAHLAHTLHLARHGGQALGLPQ